MAYSTKVLEEQSLKVIEEYNLMFFDEISAYLQASRATLYNHKLDKLDSIKNILFDNCTKAKVNLRKKWYKSNNPTLQIALYKLIGTDNEYMALANAKQILNIPELDKIGELIITTYKSNNKPKDAKPKD